VLGEGSLQDIFTASALSAVANATCGFAASHIGELSHPGGSSAGGIAPPIAVLLHGAVGAGMSAIQGRDILSGAVGAMVGEVSGMIYNRVCMADMGADHPRRAEAIQRGTDVARLTGIAVAGIGGLDPAAASHAAANAAGNNAVQLIVPALVVAAEALTTAEGVFVLGTGAVATSLALQSGLASQENSTGDPYATPRSSNAPTDPFYDPYGSAPSSSSSSLPFGDGPNTGSVLYVAPPAQPARAPGVYEQLRDLPHSMGMTSSHYTVPASVRPYLASCTPHPMGPLTLTTPIHRPELRSFVTPVYDGPTRLTVSTPVYDGPMGIKTTTPIYDGPTGMTVSTPILDPQGITVFTSENASSSDPDAVTPLPPRPIESPYYSNGYTTRMSEEDLLRGRVNHNQVGNEHLHGVFQENPDFAEALEREFPGIRQGVEPGAKGAFSREAPTKELTWHHYSYEGRVLELMPRAHHTSKGPVQKNLHPYPNGGGGFSRFSKKGK